MSTSPYWLTEGLSDDRLTNLLFNKRLYLTRSAVESLAQEIINPNIWEQFFVNVDSWLSSLLYYPIRIPTVETGKLKVGETILTNVSASTIEQDYYKFLGQYLVEPRFNNFCDSNGYTRLQVFLPFYGLVDVNINEVLNKYIQFRGKLDTSTGDLLYYIGVSDEAVTVSSDLIFVGEENVRILGTYKTTIAQQIPLGSTNSADVKRNQILSAVSTVALTGVAVGAAMLSGGSSIPATSVVAGVGATSSAVNVGLGGQARAQLQGSNLPTVASSDALLEKTSINYPSAKAKAQGHIPSVYFNSNKLTQTIENTTNILNQRYITAYTDRPSSPVLMVNASRSIQLIFYKPKLVPIDSTYNYLYGKPLGEIRVLGELEGYTEIGSFRLESEAFSRATENEKSMITTILNSGVILPNNKE